MSTASVDVSSHFQYSFCSDPRKGYHEPAIAGSGKYAIVFGAYRQGGDLEPQYVAIKILREKAELAWERLMEQEIELLRIIAQSKGVSSMPNILSAIDVLMLPPIIMCGCGSYYHPRCPKGHPVNLERKPDGPIDSFPALYCPAAGCDYELSAENVEKADRRVLLLRAPAKSCCGPGKPNAEIGTIINFVHRKAIVMPFMQFKLSEFFLSRAAWFNQMSRIVPDSVPSLQKVLRRVPGLNRFAVDWSDVLQKCKLHEQLSLMINLVDAVAWLHARGIVHKDLAYDNVMIYRETSGGQSQSEQSPITHTMILSLAATMRTQEVAQTPEEYLWSKAQEVLLTNPHRVCLVDFGLADAEKSKRSWYDQTMTDAAQKKQPFWSPEARKYRVTWDHELHIERGKSASDNDVPVGRFRLDDVGITDVEPGDTVIDSTSDDRSTDLEIVDVKQDGSGRWAHFKGRPGPSEHVRRAWIPRLGEAHDLYGLGALLYYVLVDQNRDDMVVNLSAYADLLTKRREAVSLEAPLRSEPDYRTLISSLSSQFLADDLIMTCLRSMVRGRPGCFVMSRTVRGPVPVERLGSELRRILRAVHVWIVSALYR